MIPEVKSETIVLPDGREIVLETGKLAKQAHGSVVVRMGGTMILATVVSDTTPKEGIDFLPLTVDYREKFAAAGRVRWHGRVPHSRGPPRRPHRRLDGRR